MVETFAVSLYTCDCGYRTTNSGNSIRHKKGRCGHTMTMSSVRMVLEADYTEALSKAQHPVICSVGEHNNNMVDQSTNNSNISNTNININLVLPERSLKDDFAEYLTIMTATGSVPTSRLANKMTHMAGNLLLKHRDPDTFPGSLIERNKKIVEKLPDGGERVLGKKKAVQTITSEAVDAICLSPLNAEVADFLQTEKGTKKTKMSVEDASKLRVIDPKSFHDRVPPEIKDIQRMMETHTERCLDKITTRNRDAGFL